MNFKTKYFFRILIVCLLFISTSCKNQISTQNKIPFDSVFSITKRVTIEQNKYNLVADNIRFIVKNNKLFVASSNNSIRVFTSNGKFLNTFGRSGKGPGEFNLIANLFDLEKYIGIFDPLLMRMSFFTEEGKFIYSVNLKFKYIHKIIKHKDGFVVLIPHTLKNKYNTIYVDSMFNIRKEIILGNPNFFGFTNANIFSGILEKIEDTYYEIDSYSNKVVNVFDNEFNTKKPLLLPINNIFDLPSDIKNKNINNFDDYLKYIKDITQIVGGMFIDASRLLLFIRIYEFDAPETKLFLFDFANQTATEIIKFNYFSIKYNKKFYSLYFVTHRSDKKIGDIKLVLTEYDYKK